MKRTAEAWPRFLRQRKYDRHDIKPWVGEEEIPTPEQLATLAANLSRNASGDHAALCSTALNLWATAAKFVALQKSANEDWKCDQANDAAIGIPKPKDFPVSRDEFLRLVLPGKDTAETAELCRKWLRVALAEDMDAGLVSQAKITEELIADAFGDMQRTPMDRRAYYANARSFLEWYRQHNPERVSAARSEAGSKAWPLCDNQDAQHKDFPAFEKHCAERKRKLSKRNFATWLENQRTRPAKPPKRKLKKKL